jgi:hypothetical protein
VRDATDDSAREVAASITLRVRGKPAAPSAPRVGEVRDSTVVLSWTAPDNRGEPITGYEVVASPGGRPYPCASTTCTIDGLTNNTEYTFTVAAKNAVGLSDPSPASASARPDAVPSTPGAPVWDGFGDGELTARWNVPETTGSPVTSYTLTISPAPSGGPATVTTSGTSYTFRGLTNGTAYSVQVRAHNRAPEPSAFSAPSGTQVPAAPPTAPQIAAAPVASDTGRQIDVTWAAPPNNGAEIVGYQLEISGGAGSGTFPVSASETRYALQNIPNGTTYTFRLRAQNKADWSAWSAPASATAFGIPGSPPAPTFSRASSNEDAGSGWLDVSWDGADGNGSLITSYEALASAGTVQMTGQRSARIYGLGGGAAVSVQVRACNARGCGAWGPSYTTPNPSPVRTRPAAPAGLSFTTSSSNGQAQPDKVQLTWAAPTDQGGGTVTAYEYELAGDRVQSQSGRTGVASAPEDLEWYPFTSSGRDVSFRVRAQTDVGWGSWSEWRTQRVEWAEPPPPTDPVPPTTPGVPGSSG